MRVAQGLRAHAQGHLQPFQIPHVAQHPEIHFGLDKRVSGGKFEEPTRVGLVDPKNKLPIRRPTECQPERDRMAACMSPWGVPGRSDEKRQIACSWCSARSRTRMDGGR